MHPNGRYGQDSGISYEQSSKLSLAQTTIVSQPAPTTATVGNVGDIIVDTNGDSYELIRIEGGLYYWSSPKLKRIPFFMNAGLFDFSAKNLKNRKWYFPDGTTSTAERPAVTLTRAGVVELEGDWENSYKVEINHNTTTTQYVGRLKDLYLVDYYLNLVNCSLITGDLMDIPRVSYYLNTSNCTLITGSLADIPRVSRFLSTYNCPLITGSLADVSRVSHYIDLDYCPLITGSLADVPRVNYYLSMYNCSLVTGSLPLNTIASYINIGNTGCTKSDVDLSLANLVAGHPSMSGAKTLVLTGLKRTSASSANVATLISRGWNITDAVIEG